MKVRPAHDGMQVRAGGAEPPAAVDVAVERRETLLPVAVDVVGQGVAGLLHRLEEGPEQRARRGPSLEDKRPLVAAPFAAPGEAGLHLLEVRQAMRIVPRVHARVSRPALVIQRVATLEDHPVDAAGAAEHLPPGVVNLAPAHERLRLRLVLPVVEPAPDGIGQGGGRPASSTRTRLAGSALSRFASALPAEPPPTMTKSFRDAPMAPPVTRSPLPDTQRQLVRETGLHRSHGPECLPKVGPCQRVERLGVDEAVRRARPGHPRRVPSPARSNSPVTISAASRSTSAPGQRARVRGGSSGELHGQRPHRGLGAGVRRRRRARAEGRPRPVASLPGAVTGRPRRSHALAILRASESFNAVLCSPRRR